MYMCRQFGSLRLVEFRVGIKYAIKEFSDSLLFGLKGKTKGNNYHRLRKHEFYTRFMLFCYFLLVKMPGY